MNDSLLVSVLPQQSCTHTTLLSILVPSGGFTDCEMFTKVYVGGGAHRCVLAAFSTSTCVCSFSLLEVSNYLSTLQISR